MANQNEHKRFIVPALYSIIWCLGICNAVFKLFDPGDSVAVKTVIVALAGYGIFCVNTVLDILFYFIRAVSKDVTPMFAYMFIVFFGFIFGVLLFSKIYTDTVNFAWLVSVLGIMAGSHYFMGYIKHNPNVCFIEMKGKRYSTNLK